jgi:hypothetical protein
MHEQLRAQYGDDNESPTALNQQRQPEENNSDQEGGEVEPLGMDDDRAAKKQNEAMETEMGVIESDTEQRKSFAGKSFKEDK